MDRGAWQLQSMGLQTVGHEQLTLPFPIRKGLWRRWDLITELKEPCDCQNRVLQREGTAIVKALKEGMPLKECLGSN